MVVLVALLLMVGGDGGSVNGGGCYLGRSTDSHDNKSCQEDDTVAINSTYATGIGKKKKKEKKR